MISITFSHKVVLDASREINCYLMFDGCEIVAQEEEDPRSRVEGGWAPAGRDAREQGSVGGAALGCGVPGQEEEEVSATSNTCLISFQRTRRKNGRAALGCSRSPQ
jgi:hypothetical protein